MKASGTLYRDIDGDLYFRQYTPDGGFIDYEMFVQDINVTIDDSSIVMKQINDEEGIIDYTDSVLGRIKGKE